MLSGALANPVAAKADRGRTPSTHTSAKSRLMTRLMILFFKAFPPRNDEGQTVSHSLAFWYEIFCLLGISRLQGIAWLFFQPPLEILATPSNFVIGTTFCNNNVFIGFIHYNYHMTT